MFYRWLFKVSACYRCYLENGWFFDMCILKLFNLFWSVHTKSLKVVYFFIVDMCSNLSVIVLDINIGRYIFYIRIYCPVIPLFTFRGHTKQPMEKLMNIPEQTWLCVELSDSTYVPWTFYDEPLYNILVKVNRYERTTIYYTGKVLLR